MGPTSYIDHSVRSFLLSLAERGPEPAGGAALAVAGASAAALVSMACHTADRRESGGSGNDVVARCHVESGRLAGEIERLVDEDVEAYRGVHRALRQRRNGDEEPRKAYQDELDQALGRAVDVPLRLAEACIRVMDIASQTVPTVEGAVLGDLVAAVHLAEAAVSGSLRNARINASSLGNDRASREATARVDEVARLFREQRARTARILAEAAPEYAQDI